MKTEIITKLQSELGEATSIASEYAATYSLGANVKGKRVVVVVTQFPHGENPEAYQGREMWQVAVKGEEGPLHRVANPEETLELAFQMIDWQKVAAALEA